MAARGRGSQSHGPPKASIGSGGARRNTRLRVYSRKSGCMRWTDSRSLPVESHESASGITMCESSNRCRIAVSNCRIKSRRRGVYHSRSWYAKMGLHASSPSVTTPRPISAGQILLALTLCSSCAIDAYGWSCASFFGAIQAELPRLSQRASILSREPHGHLFARTRRRTAMGRSDITKGRCRPHRRTCPATHNFSIVARSQASGIGNPVARPA